MTGVNRQPKVRLTFPLSCEPSCMLHWMPVFSLKGEQIQVYVDPEQGIYLSSLIVLILTSNTFLMAH